jgi:uncharacterized damage-inducible protein DinB
MIDVATIQELYRYNRWANHRMFVNLSNVAQEDFTRALGSSHPSIRETALHIVWAEWIWLERWKGTSPRSIFQVSDFPTLDALGAKWSEVDMEQQAFVETLPAERLLEVVPYINLRGQTWEYALWRQMVHVVNHSTYHRGQVTTMLRQVKAPVVVTDFLVFHDELEFFDTK